MIQRVQTLYLLISLVFMTGFLLSPAITHDYGKTTDSLSGYEITWFISGYLVLLNLVFVGIAAGLTLISIFLFKNRSIQSIVSLLPIGFLYAAASFVFYKFWFIETVQDKILEPGNLFLLLASVMHIFAWRAIRKDEALIKSLDRLR